MPSSGKLGAVSDYEHLKNHHLLQNSRQFFQGDDSADSDFLPLKPSKSTDNTKNALSLGKAAEARDSNTNNAAAGVVRVKNKIGLTQMLDDFGQLQALNKVPVPTAWSPSIKHAPNPALLVTPEKNVRLSNSSSNTGKENLIDLQTSSRVPVPVAWSPGMVLKPNPALMVTPDKETEKKTNASVTDTVRWKGTVAEDFLTTRNKEKPTVRFDLPSASSGEETLDASQEFFAADAFKSPITLKGCELEDSIEPASPPWKAFSPQKAYDPNAYSDESALEDSIQSPSGTAKYHSQHTNTAKKSLDIDESTSDRLADKLQELLMSSVNTTQPLATLSQQLVGLNEPESQTLDITSKADSPPSKKVMSAACMPHRLKPKKADNTYKQMTKNKIALQGRLVAGPEFLRTPPSAYEPKPAELPQPQVLREWASSPEKNNYSFPFESEAGAGGGDLVSEHTFARPEYNSTLHVRSELDELCKREIDVEKAVATALTKSESKRTELSEKASIYTNRMSDQFGNLVNLDPSVENLCSRAVRMRTSKVRAKKVPSAAAKPSKSTHTPPDLMEFLPPDLQRESPAFSLPGIKKITSGLQGAPQEIAFDLYKHNRVWQGISDY
ncbi:phosphatase 1, regulatory subunit 35 [Elysia marginata]|uniref:Phosphatase 1, regulatory subunit 35 n=1 Tax=Elysia marginata TaxID=1093978 RepID=A0AAV4I786_9GAST|nr:phosphatase 1, regulatory subunit 35 [Elysia marginata]